ncbi:CheR family methyltransferase [Melittangium boletus]|uniref:CheR family methyltransferase n=1 Tax=Melittangium boletus TaxID=83453 RepID=UPI003DA328CE
MPPSYPARFHPVHALVARRTGMALSDLQCRRLDEKLAGWGGSSVQRLLHLQSPEGSAELAELIDAITVQKTELFRDEAQLEALRAHVLAPLVARERRPLRVWSAGCATGEEVATLLVLLAEVGADPASTVLGTDISETAIQRAREGWFSAEQLQRVPSALRERWFVSVGPGRHGLVPALKERGSFLCHNLMDSVYPSPVERRGFDVIVCRNVLIYFSPESFTRVVSSFGERLAPEGLLVLSSTEPLLNTPPGLRTLRFDEAFFYGRAPPEPPAPPVPPPSGSGRFATVGSGRFAAVGSPGAPLDVSPPPPPPPPTTLAYEEADSLFSQVLGWATSHTQPGPQTEETLRRCLRLDPDLAAARYLLAMVCEQRNAPGDALSEYRRALRSLEEGRARSTPFFLNNARLQVACARAIERLERAGGPRPG